MIPSDNGADVRAAYNFAYLDESSKRTLRRAILKAVAIPGFQVPIAGCELPLPAGWGTGGIQLTAAIIGPDDRLKVVDQGADDSINAVSIRRFFQRVTGVATTAQTVEATIIQSRHRIPEQRLGEHQILVLQVPIPDPMRAIEPSDVVTRRAHASRDYGLLYVKLYEDRVKFGAAGSPNNHPVIVDGRYIIAPSPIPRFDNSKLDFNPALILFGAGRNKRVYAIPPYTRVENVAFEDQATGIVRPISGCSLCGSCESYLDEIVNDDNGARTFVCSDTSYCDEIRRRHHINLERII